MTDPSPSFKASFKASFAYSLLFIAALILSYTNSFFESYIFNFEFLKAISSNSITLGDLFISYVFSNEELLEI
jgi:hypothetical protein